MASKKRSVWRVQGPDGEGPYWIGRAEHTEIDILLRPHTGPTKAPPTYRELGRKPEPNEHHGFWSKSKAKQWFALHELKTLARFGYMLQRVAVEEVTLGGPTSRQVLFIPKRGKL